MDLDNIVFYQQVKSQLEIHYILAYAKKKI